MKAVAPQKFQSSCRTLKRTEAVLLLEYSNPNKHSSAVCLSFPAVKMNDFCQQRNADFPHIPSPFAGSTERGGGIHTVLFFIAAS